MIDTVGGRTRSLSGHSGEDGFGYSQGVLAGPIIHISGQVGRDNASGELAGPTTLSGRLGKALSNVKDVAAELGDPSTAIVYLQLHIAGSHCRHLDVIADRLTGATGEDRPAVTIVPVADLFSPEYLVEVSAMATSEPRTTYADDGSIGRTLGTSRAVRVGDEIFLAGHFAIDGDGAISGTSRAEQLEGIFRGLERTLAEAGATLSDVVSTHTWVVVGATTIEMERFHAVHSRNFAAVKPAATLLFVRELPLGAMVQMSAVARVNSA